MSQGSPDPEDFPSARPIAGDFRRRLPHFEGSGAPLFVTFATIRRWVLPPSARDLAMQHLLHDHGKRLWVVCAVVMPDHVHLVYRPFADPAGHRYTKAEVVGAIKGASAHAINRLLGRKGAVWQAESFDHVVRRSEALDGKLDYICHNPVRRGLCDSPDQYPWLWRSWKIKPESSDQPPP